MKTSHRCLLRAGLGAALPLGLCLVSAATASAQELDLTTSVLDHPAGISGLAKAVALGRYSPDAIPDAAVLHGSTLRFLYAPDRRNVWSAVSGTYTSIVTLPQVSDTDRDGVLASTAAGLSLLTYSGSTLVPQALTGTSAWAGATDMQVLASGATWRVFALDAATDDILRGTWNPATGTFTSQSTIPIDVGAEALAAFERDGDAAFEFATADAASMTFYDDNGSALMTFEGGGTDNQLLAIRDVGATDRVAWLCSPASTYEQLLVVRSDYTIEPAQLFLCVDVRQMTLVDLGEDQRKELWVTSGQFPYGLGLRRGSSTSTFLPWPANEAYLADLDTENSAYEYYTGMPGTGVYGGADDPPVAAVADMDGDGDDDLFLAGHPGQADRSLVCFGSVYQEEANILDEAHVRSWMKQYTFQLYGEYGSCQSAEITFDLPELPGDGPASIATHVRFAAWVEPAGGGGMTFVDSIEAPFGPVPPDTVITVPDLDQAGDGSTVHIEVCYLARDASGAMTWAGPALLESIPVDLQDDKPQVYVDRVWEAYLLSQTPGTSSGGSTIRPPISPPSGGGTSP